MFPIGVQNDTMPIMKRKRRLKWKRIFGLGILCVSLLCFGLWLLIHPIQERYDPDLFVLDQGIMTYQDKAYTTSIGIDVSEHNGHIDWNAVKEDGIEFAFIRLGYRGAIEGKMHEDENFRYNLEAAKQAGLLVLQCHFSRGVR